MCIFNLGKSLFPRMNLSIINEGRTRSIMNIKLFPGMDSMLQDKLHGIGNLFCLDPIPKHINHAVVIYSFGTKKEKKDRHRPKTNIHQPVETIANQHQK